MNHDVQMVSTIPCQEKQSKRGENMHELDPRILKMLMLTQSNNDAEALLAIRKANKLLKRDELSWEEVFQGRKPKKEAKQKDFFEEEEEEKDDQQAFEWAKEISEDMDYLEDREAVEDFVDGIKAFFNEKGFLSPKQCDHMKKTYEKYQTWKTRKRK